MTDHDNDLLEVGEAPNETPEPYADESEALLEGGRVDPYEAVETRAAQLVLDGMKNVLHTLVDSLTVDNAGRALAQIGMISKNAQSTLYSLHADSGIETANMPGGIRRKRLAKRRSKDRETAGVLAIRELLTVAAGFQQRNETAKVREMFETVTVLEGQGLTEKANELRDAAEKKLDLLLTKEHAPNDELVENVAALFVKEADEYEMGPLDLESSMSFGSSAGAIQLPPSDFDYEDA